MAIQQSAPLAGTAVPLPQSYLEWGPVIAGAVAAASISFLLLTFGGAVGLSLTSPWPNAGASLTVIGFAVAWWAILVQIGSFAAGGYLAGRLRSRWGDSISDDGQFRDGAHGFMVWATGVLFGALLVGLTGGAALQTATQSSATVAGGAAAGVTSNRAASLASAPTDYAVDLLLRPAGTTQPASAAPAAGADANRTAQDGDIRAEASRIFSASIRNREFTERDRNYLTQVIVNRTGLPEAEARGRVDAAMKEARDLENKAREAADKARKAAIMAGFVAAASLLIGCAAACAAAAVGGRHRDEGLSPRFFGHRFW